MGVIGKSIIIWMLELSFGEREFNPSPQNREHGVSIENLLWQAILIIYIDYE